MTPDCTCGHAGDRHKIEQPYECMDCRCEGFDPAPAAPTPKCGNEQCGHEHQVHADIGCLGVHGVPDGQHSCTCRVYRPDAPTPKEARAEGRGHSAVCKGGETPGQWSLNDLLIGVREHIREFPGVCKNIRDDVSDLLESIDNHIFFENLGKEPRPPVREDAHVCSAMCTCWCGEKP